MQENLPSASVVRVSRTSYLFTFCCLITISESGASWISAEILAESAQAAKAAADKIRAVFRQMFLKRSIFGRD